MNAYIHVLRLVLVSLALLGSMSGATSAAAQGFTPEETVRSVRRMLERLPYYGVFDYIVFRVDRGTVYLAGYSFEGRLKSDAFLDEHHDRGRGDRLGHRGNPEGRIAAHVSAVAERHLAEYECLNSGSVGNEADHAWCEGRFNVAFQSSAKLSKTH